MSAKHLIYTTILILSLTNLAHANYSLCFRINGLKNDLLENVKSSIGLNKDQSCLTLASRKKLLKVYRSTPTAIQTAIQPYGYFKSSNTSLIKYTGKHKWQATYCIYPGTPMRIKEIVINVDGKEGNSKEIKEYLKNASLKKGDIFNTILYNDIKLILFNIANNDGYINAKFKNILLLNVETYTAYIKILLHTGKKYYFGNIIYQKLIYNKSLMDKIIKNNLPRNFSSRALIVLQRKMENSDYFNKVDITPNFTEATHNKVPLIVDYTAPKKYKYSAGIGYGTLTGPKLSLGFNLQRLSQNGAHLESSFILSQILTSLHANYIMPGSNPLNNEWVIGLNTKKFSPKAGSSESATLNVGYRNKYNLFKLNVDINLLLEHHAIGTLPSYTSHILYPSFNINILKIDEVVNPNNGYNIIFQLRGGSAHLLSTTSFVQSEIRGKYIISPFSFSKIILKTDLGYATIHDLNKFPLNISFFAGGMNSIRGFPEESIGPGRYLYTGSFEYRNKIHNNLYAAFFYDLGNVSNHLNNQLNRSLGAGVVYETPVGPFKLYLSKAISKKTQPYSVEFSIGPEIQ